MPDRLPSQPASTVASVSEFDVHVVPPAAVAPPALPPPPELPASTVERLPRGELGIPELDADPFWRLVAAFLVECRREQTRRAYFNDLRAWSAWCTDRELHPLAARRHDVALWARQLANTPQRAGKAEAPASIARRLSCLSSFSQSTEPTLGPGQQPGPHKAVSCREEGRRAKCAQCLRASPDCLR